MVTCHPIQANTLTDPFAEAEADTGEETKQLQSGGETDQSQGDEEPKKPQTDDKTKQPQSGEDTEESSSSDEEKKKKKSKSSEKTKKPLTKETKQPEGQAPSFENLKTFGEFAPFPSHLLDQADQDLCRPLRRSRRGHRRDQEVSRIYPHSDSAYVSPFPQPYYHTDLSVLSIKGCMLTVSCNRAQWS